MRFLWKSVVCSPIFNVKLISYKIPIIFVTSRNSSMDELNGIMLGGDDYMEKPYNVPVLLARIQNLLNRVYPKEQKSSKVEYKGITLDILKSQVKYNDKEIELTKTEIKTLYYLLKNTDRIIARTEIIYGITKSMQMIIV